MTAKDPEGRCAATGNIAGRGTWFERIDLFLTKEVLLDQSSIGAPLRSNAEAIANNRCLAALPRKGSVPQRVLLESHSYEAPRVRYKCTDSSWPEGARSRLDVPRTGYTARLNSNHGET